MQKRLDNLNYCREKSPSSELTKMLTRDESLEMFWLAASNGKVIEAYYSPKRINEHQKCLLDVLIEFFKGKVISKWAYVSYREIESFLRDNNDSPAFPADMAQEDLFYSWVGQFIYAVLENLTQWSEKPRGWENFSQLEKIKEIKLILSEKIDPWFRATLIDLEGDEAVISLKRDGLLSAPIENALALFIRDALRRELGAPQIEILLET